MTKKAKKFAVPLNISVSKEMFDRAQILQSKWDTICLAKFDKRFRMSDLGEIVWTIGLAVLEELKDDMILDTLAKEHVNDELIAVEIKRVRKQLKTPKALSDLTDEQLAELESVRG